MPRNKKEGILFSFVMSAIMIYVMAALNYYVRVFLGFGKFDAGWTTDAWLHAAVSFLPAYVVGMICDLGFCTPSSRSIAKAICKDDDREEVCFFAVKFSMVIIMTICMTLYGVFAAAGFGLQDIQAFCLMFPFNFVLALPIQMLLVAPISGLIVQHVGSAAGWQVPEAARA